jgi:hypothetical protein
MSLRFAPGVFRPTAAVTTLLDSFMRRPITAHMKTSPSKYDPANDTYITTLFLDKDEEGGFLDVDSMLHHSEEQGFYLARTIIQVWKGRTWETATPEEAEESLREHRRSLKVFRPLNPSQVIRMVVNQFVPEEEGARELASSALVAAGIN